MRASGVAFGLLGLVRRCVQGLEIESSTCFPVYGAGFLTGIFDAGSRTPGDRHMFSGVLFAGFGVHGISTSFRSEMRNI